MPVVSLSARRQSVDLSQSYVDLFEPALNSREFTSEKTTCFLTDVTVTSPAAITIISERDASNLSYQYFIGGL